MVPFILGLAPQESYNDHGHVVAANSSGLAAWCKTIVHHVLADFGESLFRSNATSDKFDHGL